MLHEFNLTLLGKPLWRLVQFPNSLLARVLRGRYFRCSSSLQLNDVNHPSYWLKSIMAVKPLITLEIRQKLHSGNEIRICKDLWIPTIPAKPARPIAPVLKPMMPESDLMIGIPERWNTMLENLSIRMTSH